MKPNQALVVGCARSTLLVVVLLLVSHFTVSQDLVLQKCLPKADIENITIKCAPNEVIAIKAAFFTSSIVDQCPFVHINRSHHSESTNFIVDSFNKRKLSCTDDLRITLNSKCSGRMNCTVNLRKMHQDQCFGYDGWVNIRYTCVAKSRMHSYCNTELTDNIGYVSNPGYPTFYPPYICKWQIKAFVGQQIQIEILDLSIKEPRFVNKKMLSYECSDSLSIIENNAKVATLCGERKSNLIEYRSKSDHLMVEFVSYDFSPTRGVLFKYTLLNCPTLKEPSYGYMYRNGSFAYYNCHFDYVFEDTGMQTRVLYCEYDIYWNGTVARCVPKENVTLRADALTHQNDEQQQQKQEQSMAVGQANVNAVAWNAAAEQYFTRGLLTPVAFLIAFLVLVISLIIFMFRMKKRSLYKTAV